MATVPTFPPGFKFTGLDEAAGVTPTSTPGEYTCNLRADWCIGVVPHGGYLTTLLLNASTAWCQTHVPQHPTAIHTTQTFATRCDIGPATLSVTPLKLGRQFSFVRVDLHQHSNLCLTAVITHTNLAAESGTTISLPKTEHIPPLSRCRKLPHDPGAAFRVAEAKLRYWVPAELADTHGAPPGCAERYQWVCMSDGSPITSNALGLLSDMFIPLPENFTDTAMGSWYPTLWLTVEVRRPGPWAFVGMKISSSEIRNGRMDIDVVMVDEEGEVIATSRHLAIVVGAERNRPKI